MLLDSDQNRIRHMIEAISQAIEYAQGRTRAEVDQNIPLQHLFVRNIEIVGEAGKA